LLRDQIKELKRALDGAPPGTEAKSVSYGKGRGGRGFAKGKRR
jgi:hypothetical protein